MLDAVLSTRAGRALFLNIAAEAEDSDDGQLFGEILKVIDPSLFAIVERHRDDEKRHAKLFRECVERNGGKPTPVAPKLQLFHRLADRTGFLGDEKKGRVWLALSYCLIQVVEERASRQFSAVSCVLRRYDPESADVMDGIAADEVRHLGWCRKISRVYSPGHSFLSDTLREFRKIESEVFGDFAGEIFRSLDNGDSSFPSSERR